MRASPIELALLLVLVPLAGCIGAAPADPAATPDPEVITDPTDTTYNASSGYHIHDYWDGQDTLPVLDGTVTTFLNNNGDESTDWVTRFHPGDGRVVPQGTASLTVTVEWTDDHPLNSHGRMELWVMPANASQARLIEDDLAQGQTLEIPLAYEEADLPHQVISAWEFQVHIRGSPQPYNFYSGSIHVQAQAHRGLELKPFPPHPDHWGDRTELALVEETRRFQQLNWPTGGFTGNFDQRIRLPNGTIVPWGTSHVQVQVTSRNNYPAGGLELRYHPADTRNWTLLEPQQQDGDTATYMIPVDDASADGPYAEASLWVFTVSADHDWQGEVPAYNGEFTLTATAYKGS